MSEKKEVVCRGSYKLGTACGKCKRCKARGFNEEKKTQAIAAEAERTKDLPADRVKKGKTVRIEK